MTDLPAPLEPLSENRQELQKLVELLGQERDPTARAELAVELVGTSARYEDVMERAVYPALRKNGRNTEELNRAESDQRIVRDGLTDLRRRTQNVKPSNVHASDPEGFEKLLDRSVDSVRMHLAHEDEMLFPVLDDLDLQSLGELREAVDSAVAHASTHPHPPHSMVGRAVRSVMEKLDRSVHDQATPSSPETDQLHKDHGATSEPK